MKDYLAIHNKRERVTKNIADDNIGLVLEDPPFGTRDEEWDDYDAYKKNIKLWLSEGMRITKHTLIWFCASRTERPIFRALEDLDPFGKWTIRRHTWNKPEGSQYNGASNNNIWYSSEFILVISKDWKLTTSFGKDMPFAYDTFNYRTVPQAVNQHACSKPVPLLRKLMGAYSAPGDTVFDGFAGTFSTGVAAVDMGRRCILVEQSPLKDKPVTDFKGDNPDHFGFGTKRIERHLSQPRMFVGSSDDLETEEPENDTYNLFPEEK